MIDDLDGPEFCDDRGYCICGNDCMNPNAEYDDYGFSRANTDGEIEDTKGDSAT